MISRSLPLTAMLPLMLACGGQTQSTDKRSACESITLDDSSLLLTSCSSNQEVVKADYHSRDGLSLYATELDEKRVVVALSNNGVALRHEAGFSPPPQDVDFNRTSLTAIPLSEPVSSRRVDQGVIAHKEWIIGREDIEYFNPKGPAYPITCATALTKQNNTHIAVSACFDFGEMRYFRKIIDGVSASIT